MIARTRFAFVFAVCLWFVLLAGCGNDDDGGTQPPPADIQLTLTNLPASSPAAGHYELWISFVEPRPGGTRHANATPVGKFRINASGQIVDLAGAPDPFEAPDDVIWAYAVDTFITIEPDGDTDTVASGPGFIGGSIINRQSTLSTNGADALNVSFGSAAGSTILAAPSTSDSTDAAEGVWFTNPEGSAGSLTLPTLPTGWVYEGWISRTNGVATLGRFSDPQAADSDLSGPLHDSGGRVDTPGDAFPFPGSDFPYASRVVLTPGTAFVTVEPLQNQDGAGPFPMRILEGSWGAGGLSTPTTLSNVSTGLPTGTLSIPQ
jgi:hypothetical protein